MKIKERLQTILLREEYDCVFLVSQPNVMYASGFEVPYWGGFMADMARALPMVTAVLDVRHGEGELVVSDFYKSRMERAGAAPCTYYKCFSHLVDCIPEENYERAVREILDGKSFGECKIGVEFSGVPECLLQIIRKALPDAEISDVDSALEESRRIKSSEEILLIERAALAADAAQNRLIEIAKTPGDYTELDIWFEVQKSVSRYTGNLEPFYGELVTGPRCGMSDYPLGPTDRKVQKGDIAIMDAGPRTGGYWSDCSNVVVFWQEPDAEQLRYFRAVKAAYDAGREAIRPGVTFREVNQAMDQGYQRHGFKTVSYLGHQIGANVNERPRFTCYDDSVLEENMVVCIEPQLYTGAAGRTGVRLERMLHVTKDGARELNRFPWGIRE